MNREEKNQQTRRKIMDSALREFAEQGYGASSINTICSEEGISKGIIYHYFETKDELYLACVGECFQNLTEFLKNNMDSNAVSVQEQLEVYFNLRLNFFQTYPLYQRIFCDAVIMPPLHLEATIRSSKADFDHLNIMILDRILAPLRLRHGIEKEEVVNTFRQFQDYINAKYQMVGAQELDFQTHEQECHRALDILLYGVVDREDRMG